MWRKECNMAKRLYSRVKLMKLWVSVTIYTCMRISACCQYLSNVRIFPFFSLIRLQETLFLFCNLKTIQNLRGSMMTYTLSTQSLSLRHCVASSLFLLILMAGSFWSNLTLGRLLNQVRYIDSLFCLLFSPLSSAILSNKISVLLVRLCLGREIWEFGYCSTFVFIWQLVFNHWLIRLKTFVSRFPTKLCN